MALRDHIRALEPPVALTAAEYARLARWRSIYLLGATYGTEAARHLLFLRWLYVHGLLVS